LPILLLKLDPTNSFQFYCALQTHQVEAEFADAVQKVKSAEADFQFARQKAYNDLEKAKRDYQSADRAFIEARDKANRDLESARRNVDNAQRE
jgi:predicted nucleotide-binding protein (sugar kinase/HSP70/actin superfamily)